MTCANKPQTYRYVCTLPLMCVSSCAWQAFPAFNKRYAFVDGALEKGTLLVLEVEAHYPTAQFGGAK